jgi:outer membrane receptor protein involved in Fe transport
MHIIRQSASRLLLVSAAPFALLAGSAMAQTTPGARDASEPAADENQADIVVVGTAGGGTRRQDAAFAVTSLSSDAIARAAPNSTADLLRTIPGVSAESSGSSASMKPSIA